jgi:hypothetical protein
MSNPELGTSQQETATANFTDAGGNVITNFPAPPVWASSNTAALTAVAAADGLSAVLTGQGSSNAPGVIVTATATNSDGTTDVLSQPIDVVVGVAGDAVGGSITLGTPTPK